jgi:hypothetical protein
LDIKGLKTALLKLKPVIKRTTISWSTVNQREVEPLVVTTVQPKNPVALLLLLTCQKIVRKLSLNLNLELFSYKNLLREEKTLYYGGFRRNALASVDQSILLLFLPKPPIIFLM